MANVRTTTNNKICQLIISLDNAFGLSQNVLLKQPKPIKLTLSDR